MTISYKKFFKMLIDTKKKDFKALTGISGNMITKLDNNEMLLWE